MKQNIMFRLFYSPLGRNSNYYFFLSFKKYRQKTADFFATNFGSGNIWNFDYSLNCYKILFELFVYNKWDHRSHQLVINLL